MPMMMADDWAGEMPPPVAAPLPLLGGVAASWRRAFRIQVWAATTAANSFCASLLLSNVDLPPPGLCSDDGILMLRLLLAARKESSALLKYSLVHPMDCMRPSVMTRWGGDASVAKARGAGLPIST